MDTITRDRIVNNAFGRGQSESIKEKLRKLVNERQIPVILPKDKTEFCKTIDAGRYGIVELVHYKNKLYAHKKPMVHSPDNCNNILEEAIKLTDIPEHHPNIQRLYFINLKTFGFLMEYCDNGSLDKRVINKNSTYTLNDVLNWGYQLADALSFLHSKNIMHRDVKLQNILMKDNYQTLILTDYGTATNLGRSLLTNQIGTPITMAPEVFTGTKYDEQCDVYSWAIVFWQLISKQFSPYEEHNMKSFHLLLKIATENLRPMKLTNCPELFVALIYRSWHSDPNERPSLLFIKKVLRLLINALPNPKQEYSEEMYTEVKKQCMDHSDLLVKHLPYVPRLNNERSINIYLNHINKMKNILEMTQELSQLERQVGESTKQHDANFDHHDKLVNENQNLREQIKKLRANRPPTVK